MNELEKINAAIAVKQVGRIVIGVGSVILGTVLIGKFTYQRGITVCQKTISEAFSEEYAAMTAKIVREFEKV